VSPAGPYTLGQIADALGARLDGDADRVVSGVAPLETAGPDDVTFLASDRYQRQAERTRAAAVVARPDTGGLPCAVLGVAAPQIAMIALIRLFHPEPAGEPGVHPLALVSPGVALPPSVAVGPFAVIESGAVLGRGTRVGALVYVGAGAHIGEDVTLHTGVVVRDGVRIGNRVIVQPGAVLGADGFGYVFDGTAHRKIPQVGGVRIDDDVEIGANSTVDRGMLGDTVIGRGSKLDNLVQVGHNTQVGTDVILVAQVGVSGSCHVGNRAVLAGQVGIADHVTVGEGAILIAQAGVPSDVPAGEVWGGSPSRAMSEMRRIWAAERALPDLLKKVRALEKRLEALEGGARG
jgi:UDP-3-O-[3-hydroxymyristoyl] glucosamine N-acyltransferase